MHNSTYLPMHVNEIANTFIQTYNSSNAWFEKKKTCKVA